MQDALAFIGFAALVLAALCCVFVVLDYFACVKRIEAAVDRIEARLSADDDEEEA